MIHVFQKKVGVLSKTVMEFKKLKSGIKNDNCLGRDVTVKSKTRGAVLSLALNKEA
jgi:hypothetical protein